MPTTPLGKAIWMLGLAASYMTVPWAMWWGHPHPDVIVWTFIVCAGLAALSGICYLLSALLPP